MGSLRILWPTARNRKAENLYNLIPVGLQPSTYRAQSYMRYPAESRTQKVSVERQHRHENIHILKTSHNPLCAAKLDT